MPSTYAVRNYLVAYAGLVTRLLAPSVSMDFWSLAEALRVFFVFGLQSVKVLRLKEAGLR